MAHKANDGSQWTNRPQMHSQNSRLAQAEQTAGMKGKNAISESDHSVDSFTCPNCGAPIDTDAIHAGRDPQAPPATGEEF